VPDSSDIVQLKELIVALDTRQIQPSRAEEPGIAKDSSEMRARAVARLAELQALPDSGDT
jgi:hypothetical protein